MRRLGRQGGRVLGYLAEEGRRKKSQVRCLRACISFLGMKIILSGPEIPASESQFCSGHIYCSVVMFTFSQGDQRRMFLPPPDLEVIGWSEQSSWRSGVWPGPDDSASFCHSKGLSGAHLCYSQGWLCVCFNQEDCSLVTSVATSCFRCLLCLWACRAGAVQPAAPVLVTATRLGCLWATLLVGWFSLSWQESREIESQNFRAGKALWVI